MRFWKIQKTDNEDKDTIAPNNDNNENETNELDNSYNNEEENEEESEEQSLNDNANDSDGDNDYDSETQNEKSSRSNSSDISSNPNSSALTKLNNDNVSDGNSKELTDENFNNSNLESYGDQLNNKESQSLQFEYDSTDNNPADVENEQSNFVDLQNDSVEENEDNIDGNDEATIEASIEADAIDDESIIDDTNDKSIDISNSINEKKEKLQALKDVLEKIKDKYTDEQTNEQVKKQMDREVLSDEKETPIESTEEEYKLSNVNQELMSKLKELEPFKQRDRGPGYAIDTYGNTEVPDSVIRTLITRFLNQRFVKKETDLNSRSNSLEQTSGFHKWDTKAVVTHLRTHQITKVLTDKYGYEYDNGHNEHVPLSFYFDMSGSMSRYTNMLAVIAIELLKKKVKVLVGFNQTVHYQINDINKVISLEELANVLTNAGNNSYIKNTNIKAKKIDKNIDNFLLSSKAEKCVVFSDFDPLKEVINLSLGCKVYWFCFERNFERRDLLKYNGFIYQVEKINDIAMGLLRVSEHRFQTLCYLEKEESKVKRL